MATAIFYASSTGNTEIISKEISKELGDVELVDIADNGVSGINDYENVIFGIATWGDGELQDAWDEEWDNFKGIDFSNKTVAILGLGDQEGYYETFVDGMRAIYDIVLKNNARVVGRTSIDGYEFAASQAVIDDMFIGLVIDQNNQKDLTQERINNWCSELLNLE